MARGRLGRRAPLAQVPTEDLAVTVSLVIVTVGAAVVVLEWFGGGVVGLSLTVMAVRMFAVAMGGLVGGTVLLVSGLAVLVAFGPGGR